MLAQLKNLKYYVLYVLSLLGVYTWTDIRGVSIYGDDNEKKTEQERQQGRSHIYYHK